MPSSSMSKKNNIIVNNNWQFQTQKNNEERKKLNHSSDIPLNVLETDHHGDFDNPDILYKCWPMYRDRIAAEQWLISHHQAWNLISV